MYKNQQKYEKQDQDAKSALRVFYSDQQINTRRDIFCFQEFNDPIPDSCTLILERFTS